MKQIIPWTASKIERALFCSLAYYYEYVAKKKVPINGAMAMGLFLHRRAEKFYNKDEKPKYKSPKSFANAARANWKRFVVGRGKIRGASIKWKNKNEPWYLMHEMMDMCKVLYERYANEKPALSYEKSFDFFLDGRRFTGRMDEIREGYVIRDHKTGKRIPSDMELGYDPQFTLYSLAFGCLCYGDPKFASMCGVDPKDAKRWAGNPDYLSEKITVEYHYMRTGEIFKTRRTNFHYVDFCDMLDDLEDRILDKRFTPNRKNCGYCLYDEICDEETVGVTVPKKEEHQLMLFDMPSKTYTPKVTLKLKFPRLKRK